MVMPVLDGSIGYRVIREWMGSQGREPFAFQEEAWEHVLAGGAVLVNAPAGCGKTFSVFLGVLIDHINRHPEDWRKRGGLGLQLLWISPLRALAKDIGRAMEAVIAGLGMKWRVGIRNGDTALSEREKQKRRMPEVLIITPESLHLLLAQKGYPEVFAPYPSGAKDTSEGRRGTKPSEALVIAVDE